jgi:hypothetical protein
MFADKTKVLLILPQEVLDRARAYAGRATTTLKLAVSLQIVLRALIEEGLKWEDNPALMANIEAQARAVRQIRSAARAGGRRATAQGARGVAGSGRGPNRPEPQKRRR